MGKNKNKKTITQPNLILCEGEDATQFIIRYLEHLRKRDEEFEPFIAFDYGGNEELSTFLFEIKRYPGFDMVTSIIIIRDSENDHNSAIQSVKYALKKSGFPVPIEPNNIERDENMSVAFSLFPSLSKIDLNGTLEDLLIENLKEDGADSFLEGIQSFLDDLKSKGRRFKWFHKTKLHTYFSVTDDYVTKPIGLATEAGAFDLDCTEMNSLKELLRNISEK